MSDLEIKLLQKKIAGYPRQIDMLQKRYAMVVAPKPTEIGSAIKALSAYMLQLKVCRGSFSKLEQATRSDCQRLEELIDAESKEEISESVQLSHVQIQHAQATIETYMKSIDAQIDGAVTAQEKLRLAQKQKKTFDVVNLMAMIEKGDGYIL